MAKLCAAALENTSLGRKESRRQQQRIYIYNSIFKSRGALENSRPSSAVINPPAGASISGSTSLSSPAGKKETKELTVVVYMTGRYRSPEEKGDLVPPRIAVSSKLGAHAIYKIEIAPISNITNLPINPLAERKQGTPAWIYHAKALRSVKVITSRRQWSRNCRL